MTCNNLGISAHLKLKGCSCFSSSSHSKYNMFDLCSPGAALGIASVPTPRIAGRRYHRCDPVGADFFHPLIWPLSDARPRGCSWPVTKKTLEEQVTSKHGDRTSICFWLFYVQQPNVAAGTSKHLGQDKAVAAENSSPWVGTHLPIHHMQITQKGTHDAHTCVCVCVCAWMDVEYRIDVFQLTFATPSHTTVETWFSW